MIRALPAAVLLLCSTAAAAFAAGPREEAPATPTRAAPAPSIVPSVLTPLSLSVGAQAAPGVALPSAPGAARVSLPPLALPQAPVAAAAAPSSPPAGPPSSGGAAASPSGPPPGPGERGPAEGPAPGPAAAARRQSAEDSVTALAQLKSQLAELQRREKGAASGDVDARIGAKKAEIAALRRSQRADYDRLRAEVRELKRQRLSALAEARSAERTAHEYGGGPYRGTAEARGRALERVAGLDAEIARRRKEQALLERENPGFAGVRAPLVAARKAVGLAPRTAQEQKLHDEIAALEDKVARNDMAAMQMFQVEREHPDVGGAEEGMKYHLAAQKARTLLEQKRAEYRHLTGK